ncbi:hypothetical protein Tco_1309016, partial [Tanacetum coccineum]
MFGQYETAYGSQHNVGGSSSQHNVGGSSSQHNVGGSSSLVRHFSVDDIGTMYSPQFLESFREERKRLHCADLSGANDGDYLEKAQTEYQVEYRIPFKLIHCWEVLKHYDKLNGVDVLDFIAQRDDNKSKRYKSSGDSSFNMRDSGEGSFNLNSTAENAKLQECLDMTVT